jgi:D-alanyl-D-alanine carboxypeptidase/D-alanyl-D-alanine-endopeptidase (penicillin-binding protein 4)
MNKWLSLVLLAATGCAACSTQKQLARQTRHLLLETPALAAAHTGIVIADAGSGQPLYRYQGNKYFIPASNTKLLTCYAAMKYLGDSLTALRYRVTTSPAGKTIVHLQPAGDPTLLHPDFSRQPVVDFLQSDTTRVYTLDYRVWQEQALGMGWSWDDYQEAYMAERSALPVYGNVVRITTDAGQESVRPDAFNRVYNGPSRIAPAFHAFPFHTFGRKKEENILLWSEPAQPVQKPAAREIPFITSAATALRLLTDTLKGVQLVEEPATDSAADFPYTLHSQPVDSLLRKMMFRSDNFFAEQSLLMVSYALLKKMNDDAVIDTLLATDYKNLPQRPQWADGSGLSRFNLVTPEDFISVLIKMKNEFGWQRVSRILPGANEGTLTGYYKKIQGNIFAKTGTLGNTLALSGYLLTRKHRTLVFSVLINNHTGDARAIRRQVENYLLWVYNKY